MVLRGGESGSFLERWVEGAVIAVASSEIRGFLGLLMVAGGGSGSGG